VRRPDGQGLFGRGVDPSNAGFSAWEYERVNFGAVHHAYLKIGIGRGNRNRQPPVWQRVDTGHGDSMPSQARDVLIHINGG
jgi:hypothetical protein